MFGNFAKFLRIPFLIEQESPFSKSCFPVSIPKFFLEQLRWLLLNYVLVSERIFKRESGEIAFDLISLFLEEIQEPKRSSTTTRAFVFPAKFCYHKIFETRGR